MTDPAVPGGGGGVPEDGEQQQQQDEPAVAGDQCQEGEPGDTHDKEEEEEGERCVHGGEHRTDSMESSDTESSPSPTCKICFQGPEQWQRITVTLVEKVQMIAVILGSLFLVSSVTWLLWSAFSPYAVWQRRDILFQICYGMYGFMDLVCIGLIVHEGAAVYKVFKRWRAVNLHWDVMNYDKATDIEESSRAVPLTSRTLWLPLNAFRSRTLVHNTQLSSPRLQCGYVLLHLFNRMRPPQEDSLEDSCSSEVVMRVTSV
ncbi:hypothetical protein FKM82_006526 [Ascaphus truei]